VALAALASADLLRAGAGLNPMVSPAFYRLSEATTVLAARIEEEGGRVFTFDPSASSAYFRARDARGGNHETWTFRVLQATFTPEFNVAARVRTALSLDRTMLVPIERVLSPTEAGVGRFPALVDRLRRAGVRHVLSLEPLHDPSLEEVGRVSPAEIAPLDVWSYRLRGPRPLRSLAPLPGVEGSGMEASGIESTTEASDRITLSISTRTPALVVVRDAWAIGWSARVNGRDSPVLRVEGDHRATEVPAGRSTVVFEYSAPGLLPGVGLSALGLFLVIGLVSSGRRDRD
jgi:hypothetical protein